MGPLRRNASGGLRSWSSGNGSGRMRPRRGLRWWFMCCPPQRPRAGRSGDSGPGDGANATGLPATPPTRERARSARQSGRPHPAALGETVRFRPLGTMPPAHRGQGVGETVRSPGAAPCPTPTAVVAGPGAGVSGCCGGGASSLGETTVYSPSSKSPLRPYARCPMQRAMFLAFVARGLVNPAIDVARGWP